MKRKLITQMRNEWRSNIWLIVELTIVSVVVTCLFACFTGMAEIFFRHKGFSTENLYLARVNFTPEDADLYVEYPDSLHNKMTDLDAIKAKILQNPYVKEFGTGGNAMPYDYSFWGNGFNLTEPDSTYTYYGNERYVSPEIIRMLRLEGLNGETPDELASVIAKGDIILSNVNEAPHGYADSPDRFIGKDVHEGNDSTSVYHVGAAAIGMRRTDYERLIYGVIYIPMDRNPEYIRQAVIEIYPGKDKDFLESIKASDMSHGNVWLSNLRSMASVRKVAHSSTDKIILFFSVIAAFMLLLVFFGFLGTFWFRIQQRTSEIAIRMVNGATRSEIFRRLIGEGFILMAIGLVPSTVFIWLICHYDIIHPGLDLVPSFYVIAFILAAVALSVMIVAGIWVPAKKAMSINPSEALKDQ